jgi:7-carboxy-7-deazaguanine synthase
MTVTEILATVDELSANTVMRITVTGGEPLAQPGAHALMRLLCDQGYAVSLETSGAVAIDEVDPRVVRVVDIKTPGSNEQARNLWANIEQLALHDQIKFVLCNRGDYDWAVEIIKQHQLDQRVEDVLLSPSHTELAAVDLANWIVEDRLNVRMQVQLHKQLWGDVPGR